jgi:hypothetical protein
MRHSVLSNTSSLPTGCAAPPPHGWKPLHPEQCRWAGVYRNVHGAPSLLRGRPSPRCGEMGAPPPAVQARATLLLDPTSSRRTRKVYHVPHSGSHLRHHLDVHRAHDAPPPPEALRPGTDRADGCRRSPYPRRVQGPLAPPGWRCRPLRAGRPPPYLRSRAVRPEGQAWMDAYRFFERNILYENEEHNRARLVSRRTGTHVYEGCC